MAWKYNFCKLLPTRRLLLRRNWKWVKWGNLIHFALAPTTAEGEFKSFESSPENPGLSGLAAEYLSLGQPSGTTARRNTPNCPISLFSRDKERFS